MSAKEFWLEELGVLASSTRKNYVYGLAFFLDYLGVDHEGLYRMQKECLEDGDKRTDRRLVLRLHRLLHEMVDEGYSGGYAHIVADAVRKFMAVNMLRFDLRYRDLPPRNSQGSIPFNHEQILEMYDFCNAPFRKRNRALMMISKDIGFRRSDIGGLDVVDYMGARTVYNRAGDPFKVFQPFSTRKTGEIAYPHIGPEAIKAIDEYIDSRDKGPLFLTRSGERLTGTAISQLIRRLADKLDHGDNLTHHSFRKFHRTQLESRMRESWVKKLQGKATDPYTMPEHTMEIDAPEHLQGETKLTVAYVQSYDVIRVFQNRDLKRLKKTVEEQRRRIEMIPYLQSRIEAQRTEMTEQAKHAQATIEEQRDDIEQLKSILSDIQRYLKARRKAEERYR